MVVDIHSHTWDPEKHLSERYKEQARCTRFTAPDLSADYGNYMARASIPNGNIKTVVFGGKARLSGIWVPDDYIARYVSRHDNLIGFLSLDPTQKGWEDEMKKGHQEFGLKGIKLLPMYAGFSPDSRKLDNLWHYAEKNNLPVLLHTGTTVVSQAPLENTFPRLVDNVAIRFPDVKIIMAHLAHPFEAECISVVRKHQNVYADISALHYRPYQLYNSLMLAQEYGVWGKLLFGTDYPFTNVDDTIKGLRGLNTIVEGTRFPRIDETEIEGLISRDSLSLLDLK